MDNMQGPSPSLTCFMSASGIDERIVEAVRTSLTDFGVEVLTVDDIPAGPDIGLDITQAVLSADFVCLLLAEQEAGSSILFEAGVASGSRRPLLVIASEDMSDRIPLVLRSMPIIRFNLASPDLLRNSLLAYVAQVQPFAAALKINWNSLLEKSKPTVVNSWLEGHDLEQQVAGRLVAAGALVGDQSSLPGDRGVDLTATFPALGDAFSPILVEVKSRSHNKRREIGALQRSLEKSGSKLGLLVYGEIHQRPEVFIHVDLTGVAKSAVLVVSLNDLKAWDSKSLLRELTILRNQLVHRG